MNAHSDSGQKQGAIKRLWSRLTKGRPVTNRELLVFASATCRKCAPRPGKPRGIVWQKGQAPHICKCAVRGFSAANGGKFTVAGGRFYWR